MKADDEDPIGTITFPDGRLVPVYEIIRTTTGDLQVRTKDGWTEYGGVTVVDFRIDDATWAR